MTIFCYWHRPPPVLSARISSAIAITYPIKSLGVNNVTFGSADNVRAGQTILLGTYAGGSDLGRTRAKYNGSGTTIWTAYCEKGVHDGELTPAVGSYITVLNEYRVWAKIPRMDVTTTPPTIWMDGDILPGSFPSFPPPVANVGPHEAGTIDPATGLYEVKLDIINSFQFSNNTSYSSINDGHFTWFFDGGTVISGTTTSRQVTVRYPPGLYQIRLSVSADTGSQGHTAYKTIFVRDPANDIWTLPHQIVNHTMTPKGQTIELKFFQKMDPDIYRDGSMIMVWEDDPTPFANPAHRMIFVGYHLSDSSSFEHQRTGSVGETTFKFIDINGKLSETPGFSQEMNLNDPAKPTLNQWNTTLFNNILFYMCFLLQWQSTALDVADLIVPNYILPMRNFLRLQSEADNLYNQVNKLANTILPDFYLTCTRQGQMRMSIDPCITHVNDRQNFCPYVGILASNNWESVTVDNRRFPRVAELMSGAVKSSSVYVYDTNGNLIVDTFWTLAPGNARGQGPDFQQSSNHLSADQYTLNYCEGNRYARLNSPYGDIKVTAPWDNNQFSSMDPGLMGRLTVDFGDDTESPPRPPLSTQVDGLIKEISISYEYGREGLSRKIDFTIEVETDGPEAVAISKPPGVNA